MENRTVSRDVSRSHGMGRCSPLNRQRVHGLLAASMVFFASCGESSEGGGPDSGGMDVQDGRPDGGSDWGMRDGGPTDASEAMWVEIDISFAFTNCTNECANRQAMCSEDCFGSGFGGLARYSTGSGEVDEFVSCERTPPVFGVFGGNPGDLTSFTCCCT